MDKPIDIERALRNVVSVLQDRPADYRKFGPYWWPVKAMLRARGYTRDNLTVLGDYMPPDAESLIAERGVQATLRAALREYGQSHFTGILESEDADGAPYVCVDPDADGL